MPVDHDRLFKELLTTLFPILAREVVGRTPTRGGAKGQCMRVVTSSSSKAANPAGVNLYPMSHLPEMGNVR
ncbi:MAG: hypothetical protein PWR22_1726 [Moorella sp. (in: firmicutes)]|jgi:hypothetical protein|nr:hypothetical protein [Moorella sp. (in: firmicutes)]MDK2894589.1 hypothetical protein [Moorella sp. (in: firmicutes)]GEA15578.1 hypothetical protein E308F_18220 [Moorella sp. E308F]GEA19564.1 hypothetical protein E306M_27020 [Moorella sp. E306M]